MPKVIVQFGGEEWSVDLREGVNVAGRSPQAAIPIRDASMSREHCEIHLEGAVATVVDRGSMNGTLVNGTRTDRKVLVAGDKIQIGKAALFFEEKKAAPSAAPAKKPAAEPVVGLDDYAFWRKESGGMVRVLAAVVVLGLLAGGSVLLFKTVRRGETVIADPGNLIGTSGTFETGPERTIVGWAVKPGLASRIQAVEGGAKHGKSCLQLDKSGAAGDMVAEVLHQDILTIPPSGSLEVSTWVKSESSNVLPSVKVTWLAARKGPVLLETASEPLPGSSDWAQVTQAFAPPPGATHAQISLIATGRAGRVLFDDVKVRKGPDSLSLKSASFGPYSVLASPAGVLNIQQESRRLITDMQLFLASDKEGTVPQLTASGTRVDVDDAAKKLTAAGKLAGPADLRPVEFDIEARAGKDSLLLGYHLRGDSLKQVDRLGVILLLPGAELKGDYSNPVLRVWFRTEAAGNAILEISEGLMRVTADWVPEARRVVLGVPIPKGVSEMAFGFQLKAGAGGQVDPMTAAEKAEAEERMQDATELLKDLLQVTREDAKRAAIQAKLKHLEETEATDWQAVQAQRFMAELVGLKPYYESALQKLDRYVRRWPSSRRAEAVAAERTKLAAGFASAIEDREALRAHRLLDRAEEHRKEGRKLLARELCEAVRRHYGQTSAASRVAEILKSLGSE